MSKTVDNSDDSVIPPAKRKRAAKRYWVEIKGKLYARLQYKDESNQPKVKYKPITDKRTAQKVVEQMRRELEQHGSETLQSDKMTFAELAAHYEETKLTPAIYRDGVKVSGKRSIAPVKSALKPLLEYFGRRHIRSIKSKDLENYRKTRLAADVEIEINVKKKQLDEKTGKQKTVIEKGKLKRPRKVATVNRELALLRTVLNFAVQNDWLIKNPFAKSPGLVSAKAEVERDRILTFDEEKRLLAVCTDQRAHLRPLLICALDTAMRRGEMFKMRWRDVDLEAGEITIPQTNTKTDAARTVGVTPRLKAELEKLWEKGVQNPDALVFGITNTVKGAWETACRLAGVKNFRLHDCRHAATTRFIAAGVPHVEVMKITGHTQLKTFLRYLNITPETARSAAEKLNDYIESNQKKT
jgi:integrase